MVWEGMVGDLALITNRHSGSGRGVWYILSGITQKRIGEVPDDGKWNPNFVDVIYAGTIGKQSGRGDGE